MAATTPARLLGVEKDLGSLTPGRCANIVALDENMQVSAVLRNGVEVLG
jgi:N-acetylglucosamine-6-phosphate deacetylase